MRMRLAGIGVLLAGIWIVTPMAASAHILGSKHDGPPAVGAGTVRLQVTGSRQQNGQGNDRSATSPAAVKPVVQTSPATSLLQK